MEPFIYGNISDYIKKNGVNIDILDVGCGCGYLTASIAKKFPESKVEGIDISESAIACARSHFDIKFNKQDILDFDENKKVDVVVYNMVLHNIQDLDKTIQKTSSILKPKGIVIITVPHPAFWLPNKAFRGVIDLDGSFNYNLEVPYQIPFRIENGFQHKTKLTYHHRRLSTYINIFSKYLRFIKFEEMDSKNIYPTFLMIVLENDRLI